jgi:hypothetical protein
MHRTSSALVLAVCLIAAPAASSRPDGQGRGSGAAADDGFEIRPEEQFGPVRETTSRLALAMVFPAGSLRDGDVYLGEGFCAPGTHVFAGTNDEIEIAWQDAARSRVAFVRTTKAGGRWRTSRGVRIGTLLTDLERLSGTVLMFSGFGWDYGGGLSWSEPSGSIDLRLAVDAADAEKMAAASGRDRIEGDHPVRSDDPLVRSLHVRVVSMAQGWGAHAREHDCGCPPARPADRRPPELL